MTIEVRTEIAQVSVNNRKPESRIAVRPTRRFPGDYDMSKSIPGGRWHKEDKYWHYPQTLVTCRALREVYTDMLVIGPVLTRWARDEIAKSKYLGEFVKQKDADLLRIPEIAPALAAAMGNRTYQRVGARFLAMTRSVLLADEPTLGKTIQYLGGVIEAGMEEGNHLVIAPKSSLKSVWANEVHKWTSFHAFWMPEGKAKREKMLRLFLDDEHPSKFLIVNPQILQVKMEKYCRKCGIFEIDCYRIATRKPDWPDEHYYEAHDKAVKPEVYKMDWPELFEVDWSSICIDEAHNSLLGNQGVKRTQAAEGFMRLRSVEGGLRIASTGTPLKGRPLSFWSILNWLYPKIYTSKWAWAESFLEISTNVFGSTIGDVRTDREEALYESLRTVMLRRTKREVQPDLPEDLTLDHWVDMPDKHRKQYEAITLEGEMEIEGGSLSTQGVLAEYTRQKQFSFGPWRAAGGKMVPDAGSPKAELLFEMLAERGVSGKESEAFRLEGAHKYIIGSQFTSILDTLDGWLWQEGILTHKITGGVSAKKREAVQDDWQNNPDGPRVLLVNTIAGGTALTLDAMCDEMFILDETWVSDDQFQLEGRIRNRDVEKRVAVRTYHYIRTRGTIEEEIAESGLKQEEFQKKVLDRSRGHNVKKREIKK